MKITGANIVSGIGTTDGVGLTTDLPNPFADGDPTLAINFTCPRGTGRTYVEAYFPGVPVTEQKLDTRRSYRFGANRHDGSR